MTVQEHTPIHIPVLLEQVLYYLSPQSGETYLDLTAGYGGHAREILALTHGLVSPHKSSASSVLVDRDSNAIVVLEKEFAGQTTVKTTRPIEIIRKDFYGASMDMRDADRQFDIILADLGVSSPHLDAAERGFAIAAEGPLDMRMDQSQTLTAADIVNTYSVDDLASILERYGEEPKSRQIARLIAQHRPFSDTTQLAATVSKAWAGKKNGHSRVHPATRTFQALRIAVNDELRQLQDALPLWMSLLAPGGRLVVISFHSLEDRIVKQAFAEVSGDIDRYDTEFQLLTKRPVTADPTEVVFNPRARSAKLRAVCKHQK